MIYVGERPLLHRVVSRVDRDSLGVLVRGLEIAQRRLGFDGSYLEGIQLFLRGGGQGRQEQAPGQGAGTGREKEALFQGGEFTTGRKRAVKWRRNFAW